VAWPYRRPADETSPDWWNGFVYSSWQLLHVQRAVEAYQFIRAGRRLPVSRRWRDRRLILALAALATTYLPGVLGRLTWPVGVEEAELHQYRAVRSDPQEMLRIAGFDLHELVPEADALLLQAHKEPLANWLPLVRHSSYSGWSKLRGEPLDAMWRRVAAEVLLRAHEDLAATGVLEPLPDLTGVQWWTAQHDRLTARHAEAETLERSLATLGLSPHPKVILLVEGETELQHVPRLLAEFGITQPQDVRVQHTKGSKVDTHLIARYGVTPRVGRKLKNLWLLDATPTALMIAMDAENLFETEAKRDRLSRSLKDAIREGVRHQDADIDQQDLDLLVNIRVWGADKYELANFTDDELVPAIRALAKNQGHPQAGQPIWEQHLRAELLAARDVHADIKIPIGRMKLKQDKLALAKLLWPSLLSKCEAEYAADTVTTPVLKVVLEVRELMAKLAGVRALAGSQ
jgi:hypothetical protein